SATYPPSLHDALPICHEVGPRMSQAVTHNGIVYLAGQVGEGDTVKAQTEATLKEIDRLLALANSSKSRILSAQIWLADIADFDRSEEHTSELQSRENL